MSHARDLSIHLLSPHDLVNCFVLSNDEVAELGLQMLRRPSVLSGPNNSILGISNSLANGKRGRGLLPAALCRERMFLGSGSFGCILFGF
jgi:hypothetical protein